MRVWRLCHQRFAATAFDGVGAKLYGGRWNHIGVPVVYCASTLSLAALETLVHHHAPIPPDDFVALPADLPPRLKISSIAMTDLPADWFRDPAPAQLQQLGSDWLRSLSSLALAVPSALVPQEFNYLLNPRHPDFQKLRIGEPQIFPFDQRLWH